jgi:hypothetical protein
MVSTARIVGLLVVLLVAGAVGLPATPLGPHATFGWVQDARADCATVDPVTGNVTVHPDECTHP